MSVRRLSLGTLALLVFLGSAAAQGPTQLLPSETLSNWPAAPFWLLHQSMAGEKLNEAEALNPMAVDTVPTPPLPLVAINPCRIVDTRGNGFTGAYGPPALTQGAPRNFTLTGQCGISGASQAVSLNITVTNTQGPGFILIYPQGGAQPNVSTLNYVAGQTVANAAVVPLGTAGGITVIAGVSGTDLIIDTNGYYAPQTAVNTVNGLSGAVTLAAGSNVSLTPSGNTLTIGTDATSANTANTIVRRDGTGSFSAGTVALSGNLILPVSSFTAGQIVQNGSSLLRTSGSFSIFLGNGAGNFTTSGDSNIAVGVNALNNNASGSNNTAIGVAALPLNTDGTNNTAYGAFALFSNSTGSDNIGIGVNAGSNLTTGTFNIAIGNSGAVAESGTIRIGIAGVQTRAFLAGVRGMATGSADGLAVLIDSNGQLGTISSSASVKREIADVGDASSSLLNLRPVSFFYRNDTMGIRQYGLIAEEVAQVMPELVQFSSSGDAETVRYHFLAPLLLNELQREHRRNEEQESTIEKLQERLDALEARLAAAERPGK